MEFDLVIPARMASSRFPGKPLVLIKSKPLIIWVCENAAEFISREKIFVSTDSFEIARVVESFGFNTIMTKSECLTGTDRVAETARELGSKAIINLQGDEPMVKREHLDVLLTAASKEPRVTHNCFSIITDSTEMLSQTVPKVVVDNKNRLLFASRSPIPFNKSSGEPGRGLKQVCIYYFPIDHLRHFGVAAEKTYLESQEDIEILRLVERGETVRMHEVVGKFQAVDLPTDVEKVEKFLGAW